MGRLRAAAQGPFPPKPSRPSRRGLRRKLAKRRKAPKLVARERKLLGGRHISQKNAKLVNAYGSMVGARVKTGRREFMYLPATARAKMRLELVQELATAARAGGGLRAWVIKLEARPGLTRQDRTTIARARHSLRLAWGAACKKAPAG